MSGLKFSLPKATPTSPGHRDLTRLIEAAGGTVLDDDEDTDDDEDAGAQVLAALAKTLDTLRVEGKARPSYKRMKGTLALTHGQKVVEGVKKQVTSFICTFADHRRHQRAVLRSRAQGHRQRNRWRRFEPGSSS